MTQPTLTDRQESLLTYIETTIAEQGHPPTLYEMAHEMGGITVRGVIDHLKALEKKGYLRRHPGKRRAIELLQSRAPKRGEVPILGKVAAGVPLLAVENREGALSLGAEFLGSGAHFALRVQGNSMTGAGIQDGDYVIVHQQETAGLGDIVVALIGDEVTVKRFRKKGRGIFLEAANPAYPPIPLTDQIPEPRILGRVVGLYRVMLW